MLFVTVGSQKFQFNRLLQAVDECVAKGFIDEEVFAQTGTCTYIPKAYSFCPFLDREEFSQKVDSANVIVTHGGTGTVVGALKRGKRVIAMARLSRYGEHVDDHQVQLLNEFEKAGLILTCEDSSSLAQAFVIQKSRVFSSFNSNTQVFIDDLDCYLQSNVRI